MLNNEIIFCKYARSVKIKDLDTGKVICGVQAAGVFWINLIRVFDIVFHEEDTLAGARRRAISVDTQLLLSIQLLNTNRTTNITVPQPLHYQATTTHFIPT